MELAQLSPAARKAAAAKAINGEWDYAGFDQLLKELIAHNGTMDARIKRRWLRMTVSVFICVFALVAMAVMLGDEYLRYVGLISFVGAVANLIWSIQLWRKSKTLALAGSSLKLVHQLARLLRQDLDPKTKIIVSIDLSGPTYEKKKKWIKAVDPTWMYLDPWCTLRFKLRDGYVVLVRQTDSFIERTRTKRKGRGREETKTKWKKRCRVTTRLIPPAPVVWGTLPTIYETWERFKMVAKGDLFVPSLDRRWSYKERTDPPSEGPPAAEVVGMLIRLCSMRPLKAK